ncbi:ATPase, partial [Vibrio xuii]
RTIRGMSNDFVEQSIMDYAASRERQFQDWRNFLHNYDRYRELALGFELTHAQMLGLPFIFTDVCQGNPTQWPYTVYCGAPKAVDKARDALVNILITPDHTCEIENADGSFTYKKLADIISNYSMRNNFPVNYVPTSCFDDTVIASLAAGEKVIGEVGKFLNSGSAPRPAPVNNYSNYIDYIGHWPDKLAAASVLVDRIGTRRSTSRSISSLIELPETTGVDSQGFFTV